MRFDDDKLTLRANGREFTGWTSVRVSRGIEHCPSDFEIGLTERDPNDATQIALEAGMACEVMIGSDTVINGYVDRVILSLSARGHQVRIQGRSKCQDLTDCSVAPEMLTGGQVFTYSLLDLATKLCARFGITVAALGGVDVQIATAGGDPVPISAILSESGWEVLDRVARFLGVLLYDDTHGNLVIANVATGTHASGFAQGVNVQAAGVAFSMDERFSVYYPSLMSTNFYGQQGVGGMPLAPAIDQGVTRYRPRVIVSEQFQYGKSQAERMAEWEAARRFGRSQAIRATCDSWRDRDGMLWTPNFVAPVDMPALKITRNDPTRTWVISRATFFRDADRGTVTDLVMMPKQAFQPKPTILLPFLYDPTAEPAGMVGRG